MEINEFLHEINLTKTKFSYAIGMKNTSSLGRYKEMNDLLKIKRTRSRQSLNILFSEHFSDEKSLEVYINELLASKEERNEFLARVSKLEEFAARNEKLNELSGNERSKLVRQVFNLESIALENNDLLDELDIFLKLINSNGGNELSIILKYLLKMNNKLEFSVYEKENQKEVEAMLFLALNNNERDKFIEKNAEYFDDLLYKYETRVIARSELLNEQEN